MNNRLRSSPFAPPGYEFISHIGRGSFGTVSKIRRVRDGQEFACKEMNYGRMSDKEKELLVSEVNLMREFNHKNIVQYIDRYLDREHARIFIIMEYCPKGDLASYIKRHARSRSYISEAVILSIMTQILLGLEHCHSHSPPVLHRDLKPGNVMLTSDDNVKLVDFGLARALDEGEVARTMVGTPLYMSPEQVSRTGHDAKSDIWALGCVIYELASLKPPFVASDQDTLNKRIMRGVFAPLPTMYSDDLKNIVMSMLTVDSNRRPSVSSILKLPILNRYVEEYNGRKNFKRREDYYNKKNLSDKERELNERENRLNQWEKELQLREQRVRLREMEVKIGGIGNIGDVGVVYDRWK